MGCCKSRESPFCPRHPDNAACCTNGSWPLCQRGCGRLGAEEEEAQGSSSDSVGKGNANRVVSSCTSGVSTKANESDEQLKYDHLVYRKT